MSSSTSIAASMPRASSRGPLAQKRPLSDSEDTDEIDTKRIRNQSATLQNVEREKQRDSRDKKRRRRKKRKTSVVVVDVASASAMGSAATLRRSSSNAPSTSVVTGRATSSTLSTTRRSTPPAESTRHATAGPSSTRLEADRAEDEAPRLSIFDKGKGRASPVIRSENETSAPANSIDTSDIDFELASKLDLVSRHEALLGTLTQSLTCQICLELMYKPYALACGHSACYDCLVGWFSAPQGAEMGMAQVPAYMRRKTCPHCRADVREPPTEVWNIKDMVDALVKSKFVEPHPDPPAPTNRSSNVDPWAGIFKKANVLRDGLPEFLFGPPDHHHHHLGHVHHPAPQLELGPEVARRMMGMRDEEDGGIYRCIDCYHEIWDGMCSRCGRVYPGHAPSEDEDAGLAATRLLWDDADASDYDDEDDDDFAFDMAGYRQPPPWLRLAHLIDHRHEVDHVDEDTDVDEENDNHPFVPPPFGHLTRVDYSEDEHDDDDADDDSYEGSFIDDSDIRHIQPRLVPPVDHDQDDLMPPRRDNRGTHSGHSSVRALLSEDEDEVRLIPGLSRMASVRTNFRRGRGALISDDEDEAANVEDDLAEHVATEEFRVYGDDGSAPRFRYHPALEFSSDEEDDGFEYGEDGDPLIDDGGVSEDDGDSQSEHDLYYEF